MSWGQNLRQHNLAARKISGTYAARQELRAIHCRKWFWNVLGHSKKWRWLSHWRGTSHHEYVKKKMTDCIRQCNNPLARMRLPIDRAISCETECDNAWKIRPGQRVYEARIYQQGILEEEIVGASSVYLERVVRPQIWNHHPRMMWASSWARRAYWV